MLKELDDPVSPATPKVAPVKEPTVGSPKSPPAINAPAVNPPVSLTLTSTFVKVASYGILYREFVFFPVVIAEEAEIVNVATSISVFAAVV